MATLPSIERIKTECYFIDAEGGEWQVWDARRVGTRLRREYPSFAGTTYRYFVRFSPIAGAWQRRPIEIRRYRFKPGESRWFEEDRWLVQLAAAESRPIRESTA